MHDLIYSINIKNSLQLRDFFKFTWHTPPWLYCNEQCYRGFFFRIQLVISSTHRSKWNMIEKIIWVNVAKKIFFFSRNLQCWSQSVEHKLMISAINYVCSFLILFNCQMWACMCQCRLWLIASWKSAHLKVCVMVNYY